MGTNPGFDAPKTAGILSRLPEITIPVVKLDFLTGKLIFRDQNGTSIDRKNLTVTLADSAGNGIAVAEDGTFKAYAEEYFYTVSGAGVEYATGSVTMKEEGGAGVLCPSYQVNLSNTFCTLLRSVTYC